MVLRETLFSLSMQKFWIFLIVMYQTDYLYLENIHSWVTVGPTYRSGKTSRRKCKVENYFHSNKVFKYDKVTILIHHWRVKQNFILKWPFRFLIYSKKLEVQNFCFKTFYLSSLKHKRMVSTIECYSPILETSLAPDSIITWFDGMTLKSELRF